MFSKAVIHQLSTSIGTSILFIPVHKPGPCFFPPLLTDHMCGLRERWQQRILRKSDHLIMQLYQVGALGAS